jgi:serine/threonine protein kinase/tetratricopeptide (TPR) repeat protein
MKCPKCETVNPTDSKFCKECATPLPAASPQFSSTETFKTPVKELTTGSTFAGRYQIIEELGHGGMGKVYKVFDTDIKEKIALKLLRPEIALDKETVERFSNELKLARKISHRNVCRMFDLGKAEGTTFITMEFVPGEDLKKFIRKSGQLGAGRAVSIAKQVCEGLAEAHHLGVVHRDLKPQNIMVDEDGNARIMDFGIARSLQGKGITGPGVMIGTPEYMSPEQVEGKDVDQRSDIYSLGVILYEMTTGRVPFEGDTPFTVGVKHKSEMPKDPRSLNTQIPEDLDRLILKCLEKNREKRYQAAAELAAELDRIEKGLPTTEKMVSAKRPLTSRQITVQFGVKKLLIPAALLLVAAVAVLAWLFLSQKTVTPFTSAKPTLAVLYFKNNSGDTGLDKWKDTLPSLLISELRRSRLIIALDENTIFGLLKKMNLLGSEKYSPEDLVNIARQGGASYLVTGNYLTAGGHFLINLSLVNGQTGSAISTSNEEAPSTDAVSGSVVSLAKKIKTALNIPEGQVAADMDRVAGDVHAHNLQALQYYLEGEDFYYKWDAGNALVSFEKALALDPEFSMAYILAAPCYRNQRDFAKADEYLKKAARFKSSLSEKECLCLEAFIDRGRMKTLGKAVATLKKLVERYPDYYLGRYQLASLLQADYVGDLDEDILQWKYFIQNKIRYPRFYYFLAHTYALNGQYEQAREIFELENQEVEETGWNHVFIAEIYVLEKKFDLALAEFEKAITLFKRDPSFKGGSDLFLKACQVSIYVVQNDLEHARRVNEDLLKGKDEILSWLGSALEDILNHIDYIQGKLERVNKVFERDIPKDDFFALSGHYSSWGTLFLQYGYPQKAGEKLEEALGYIEKEEARIKTNDEFNTTLAKQGIIYWLANAYIKMGEIGKAEATLKEYKRLIPDVMKKNTQSNFSCLEGNVALAKKDYVRAVTSLEESVSTMRKECFDHWTSDQAFNLDCLADAYFQSGNFQKAEETYKRILDLQGGRWPWGAIYAKAYYKLGIVNERKGDKATARDNYRKFLDLWRDADAGLPEIADAKKRLAAL